MTRSHATTAAFAFALLLAAPEPHAAVAAPETATPTTPAEWIARMDEALQPGRTMVARVRIATRDERGGESSVALDVLRATHGSETRTLIEVESPAAGKGFAYEIVARPDDSLERWVWLPEVRRLRKIAGVRRTDPFLGTVFTYEDLALATPVERREGSGRWVGEGDDRMFELVSPPYHYYDRVVTRIDAATGLPRTVLFYDRAGQLFREQHFEDVRKIDGRRFPTRIRVRDRLTGEESILTFESIRFDVAVPPERFSESIVQRRLAGGEDLIPEAADPASGDD